MSRSHLKEESDFKDSLVSTLWGPLEEFYHAYRSHSGGVRSERASDMGCRQSFTSHPPQDQ
jgi:hypothetical protein